MKGIVGQAEAVQVLLPDGALEGSKLKQVLFISFYNKLNTLVAQIAYAIKEYNRFVSVHYAKLPGKCRM